MSRRVFSFAVAVMVATFSAQAALAAAATTTTTTSTAEVSVARSGAAPNGYGDRPAISGDGTHVTFDSDATDLSRDPAGRRSTREVFERDLSSGVTRLVSIGRKGRSAANAWTSLSWPDGDGRLVTFTSDAGNLVKTTVRARSVFLRNMSASPVNGVPAHSTILVSRSRSGAPANGPSSRSTISANGRYVVYDSTATNLTKVAPDGQGQEYVYDVATGRTRIVSTSRAGAAANALSYRGYAANNGRTVVFDSAATDLTSRNTNGLENIYLKNLSTGVVRAVSNKYPSRYPASGSRPYMTPNGRWIVFNSNAALLASDTNGTTDVYVFHTTNGRLTLGSPGRGGTPGDGASLRGYISDNGRYVVFSSFADNLVSGDTNGHGDCFSYDRTTGTTRLLSRSPSGPANGNSFRPVPSGNGAEVAFLSIATDLVTGSAGSSGGSVQPADGNPSGPYEVFAVAVGTHSTR